MGFQKEMKGDIENSFFHSRDLQMMKYVHLILYLVASTENSSECASYLIRTVVFHYSMIV